MPAKAGKAPRKVRKARTTQGAKAKGRNHQKATAKALLEAFPGVLEEGDIRSLSMGASGHDLIMSPLALRTIPFDFECKNVEDLQLWSAIRQACARDDQRERHPKSNPALVFKRNYTKAVAVVPFGWLYNVLLTIKHLPDRATLSHEDTGERIDLFLETYNAAFHDDPHFKFWDWMTGIYSGFDYVLFNRADPEHIVWVAMPWPKFIQALKDNHATPPFQP